LKTWKKRISKHQALFIVLICGIATFGGAYAWYSGLGSADRGIAANYKIVWVIPHTHFDPWWLDPWHTEAERWSANVRNALDLMRLNKDMCFVIDQMVGMKYFWEHYPSYRTDILRFIGEGRLEIVQGFVSQPEMNIVGEIGLIQDAVLGIKWAKDVLNANITTGWQIDVFGFGAGTPTFYRNLGLNYCIFTRSGQSMWDGVFTWTGVDNSTIYGYKLPNYSNGWGNDGGYATAMRVQNVNEFIQEVHNWINPHTNPFQHTVNPGNLSDDQGDLMIFYGSDFSNPNMELPGYVKAWNAQEADRTGYVCKIGTPKQFFDRLGPLLAEGGVVHTHFTYERDLNPVFPGYYTSRVNMKNFTRYFEQKLTTLETFASIAKQSFQNFTYPEPDFETAWFKATASHHHDSVTGTSRQPVYDDNIQVFYQEMPKLQALESDILGTIVDQVNITYHNATVIPVVLFNPLGWNRTEPIEVAVNTTIFPASLQNKTVDVEVIDPDGDIVIPSQVIPIENGSGGTTLGTFKVVFVSDVPSMGYKTYVLRPLVAVQTEAPAMLAATFNPADFTLENSYYKVEFNKTGNRELTIIDKAMNWQVLNEDTDQWQLLDYTDRGDTYFYGFRGIRNNITALAPQVLIEEQGPARIHVKFRYVVSNSEYNRSIFLADNVKRVEFRDEMNLQPDDSTSIAFRFAFNVTQATHEYDAPFGFTSHEEDQAFYPALYHLTVKNATHAVSLVNSGIHGYRRVGDQLEGVLVRYLNNSNPEWTEGSGVVVILDNGYFNFNYAITTYAPNETSHEGAVAQQKLDYEWNFPVTTAQGDLHGNRPLPVHQSFFSVNSTQILALGMRKVLRENGFTTILLNTENATINAAISLALPISGARNATFLNDPISVLPANSTGINVTIPAYAWKNLLTGNDAEDVNGPRIGTIEMPDAWTGSTFTLEVTVEDTENNTIDTVWLELCFNETFEGQTWTSIPMVAAGGHRYRVALGMESATLRPIYFRVRALDSEHNVQASQFWTVVDQPAFTTAEISVSLVLVGIIALIVLAALIMAIRGLDKVKQRASKQPGTPRGKMTKTAEIAARWLVQQVLLPIIVPFFLLGPWLLAWLMAKGFFGSPDITILNPGYNRPYGGASFPWTDTIRNNLFDFFVPDFFIGTFLFGLLAFLIVLCLPKAASSKGRIFSAMLGTIMVPLAALVVYPVLFIVGSAPASYWPQIASAISLLYHTDLIKLMYWYFLPLFIAAFATFLGTDFAKWIWLKVIPPSTRMTTKMGAVIVEEKVKKAWGKLVAKARSAMKRGGASNQPHGDPMPAKEVAAP